MAIKFLNTVAVDTDVLYVDTSSNNVGIGTTSPGVKLHVDSSSYGEIAKFGNGNVQLSFGMESTHGYINAQIQGTTFRNLSLNPGGGNVGIGTTGPSQKLDVVGSAQITNDIYLGRYIFHDGDTDTWFGFPLADTISFRTNNSDRMYITSAGNVGIGTTSPASKLTIGDISLGATGGLKIEDPSNTAYGAHYSFDDASSTVEIGGVTNNTLNDCISIARDTGRTITIDTNAKVGIGTTSPTSKLHVAQDQNNTFSTAIAWTASANDVLNITNNNSTDTNNYASLYMRADGSSGSFSSRIVARNTTAGTGELHFQLRDSAHTANTETKLMIDSGGNVGIGTTSPSHPLTIVSSYPQIKIQQTGQTPSFTFGSGSGYAVFDGIGTSGSLLDIRDDGTSRMRIDASGNVGIGTTSPAMKLEVEGGDALLQLSTTSSTGNPYMTFSQAGTRRSFIQHRDSGDNLKIASEYGSISLFTGTGGTETERVTILSGGNVGIGTTSPSQKLDVAGDATFDGRIYSNATALASVGILGKAIANGWAARYDSNNANYSGFYFDANNDASMVLRDDAGNMNVYLRSDSTSYLNGGNVGIGTTSPQEKLHVQNYTTGESHQAMFKGGAVTVGDYSYISLNNGYGTEYNKEVRLAAVAELGASNKTGFAILTSPDSSGASGHERLRVTADGDVGIGTTSPSTKLHALGTSISMPALGAAPSAAQFGGSSYGTLFSTLTTGRGVIQQGRVDGTATSYDLLLQPVGGNVGIGTTSATSPLHIQKTLSGGQVMAYFDGTVGPSTYGALNVRVDNIDYGTGMRFYRSGTYDSNAIGFINGTSTVGSININTSSTSYNTTSDYRLKENLTEITDGIDRIKQLKPKRFNFIGDTTVVDGFIAHEAKQVVPEAVTGEKDEVLPNGDPVYQGIDQAKIVPLLTAALQEAIAKIEVLENRLQILENK